MCRMIYKVNGATYSKPLACSTDPTELYQAAKYYADNWSAQILGIEPCLMQFFGRPALAPPEAYHEPHNRPPRAS